MIKFAITVMMAIVAAPEDKIDVPIERVAMKEQVKINHFVAISEPIQFVETTPFVEEIEIIEELNDFIEEEDIAVVDAQDQEDLNEKAKKVLDELSKATDEHKTMTIDFKMAIKTSQGTDAQTGKAYTKGDKFFYKTEGNEVFSDGVDMWNYSKDDNEVFIDALEDVGEGINPSEILTIWEENFTFKYLEEGKSGSDVTHKIKLYPKDPKKSKYHTVTLTVNGTKKQVKKASIKMKDGATIIFTITKFASNQEISDAKFKWDKSKHPGVTETDNR